ncbi:hypothetical protein [Gimesia aquarii]|uniref:Uncharacterized protein n=1 Tax=Gimesia aquarii TaxID=2527964 RepID=A0A517W069_9PLAN|nr:hypothetical protein [Gimesia aquarii]QDT98647.1 hypothetical protein V144x_41540 [Gimesia aquarii]
MLIWFVLIFRMPILFLITQHHGELHESVKRSICAVLSQTWYLRGRISRGFSRKQTILDQNSSVHRELNVRRYLQNFECIAGFVVNVFAAEEVITIRKRLPRARQKRSVPSGTIVSRCGLHH